jgi:glycosyltransferase involved in cell wall biosynthesis
MKLVIVTAFFPFGKGETFLEPEMQELVDREIDFTIVPRNASGEIFHHRFSRYRQLVRAPQIFSRTILVAAVAEILRNPVGSLKAIVRIFVASSARIMLKNLAVVPKGLWLGREVRESQVTHIHCHWAGTTATLAWLASMISGVPWSCTAHRWDICENNQLVPKYHAASFFRFISASGLRMAGEIGVPVETKAKVIHMGVPFPETLLPDAAAGRTVVVCPANLLPVKGHRYLLEAIAILKDSATPLSLLVAGDGPLEDELHRAAEALQLTGQVTFCGRVDHAALLALYARREVGVVVLPSLDLGNHEHEGIPVALIEAMAYGIPVVATATGGIPELLAGGAGILVPEADAGALANALRQAATDSELRSHLIAAGRERVHADYDVRQITTQMVHLMERTMGV